MTPHEVAAKAAEEVLQVIERTKRIIKSDIAEAIEKVIAPIVGMPAQGGGGGSGDPNNPNIYTYTVLDRPALQHDPLSFLIAPCPGGTRKCYLPECVNGHACMHREPGGAGYCWGMRD